MRCPSTVRLLTVCSMLASSGCSFLFMKPPPAERTTSAPVQCTAGITWPVVDAVLSAASAANAVHEATRSTDAYAQGLRNAAVAVSAVAVVAWGVSAYYGYQTARECRTAQRAASGAGAE